MAITQTLVGTSIGALLAGLLTYALLRWQFWDIDMNALSGIVGAGAVAGGALGAWLVQRLSTNRKPGARQ